jgi:hypothetical protein
MEGRLLTPVACLFLGACALYTFQRKWRVSVSADQYSTTEAQEAAFTERWSHFHPDLRECVACAISTKDTVSHRRMVSRPGTHRRGDRMHASEGIFDHRLRPVRDRKRCSTAPLMSAVCAPPTADRRTVYLCILALVSFWDNEASERVRRVADSKLPR